jgi:uncharacterized protein
MTTSNDKAKVVLVEESEKKLVHNKDVTTSDSKTFVRITNKFREDDTNGVKLNEPTIIAGFPGPGLVGSISANYIIDKLNMHQIACIESEFIISGVIYTGGKLRHPFRIYTNDQRNICVVVCEAPIMVQGIHSVLDTLMKWSINNNVKEVLVLEGIAVQSIIPSDSKRESVMLSSYSSSGNEMGSSSFTRELQEQIDNNTYPQRYLKQSTFIGGISGGLLSSCLYNEIPCNVLLIPASSGIPDLEGAAIMIESLNRTSINDNLKLDAIQLREQGLELKKHMEEIIRSIREQQQEGRQQQMMYG